MNLTELKKQRDVLNKQIYELEQNEQNQSLVNQAMTLFAQIQARCSDLQLNPLEINSIPETNDFVLSLNIKPNSYETEITLSVSSRQTIENILTIIHHTVFKYLFKSYTFKFNSNVAIEDYHNENGTTIIIRYNPTFPNSRITLPTVEDIDVRIKEHGYTSDPTLDIILCENVTAQYAISHISNFHDDPKINITLDFGV